MKIIVNILTEIKAQNLGRYLTVNSSLWNCYHFWCYSFKLGSCSQIATFWEHAPLILEPQSTSPLDPPLIIVINGGMLVPQTNSEQLQITSGKMS